VTGKINCMMVWLRVCIC